MKVPSGSRSSIKCAARPAAPSALWLPSFVLVRAISLRSPCSLKMGAFADELRGTGAVVEIVAALAALAAATREGGALGGALHAPSLI